jgi:iron(III) transport system substrate-binding protein
MDALHENIAQYTHSGSKPCNMAAAGEYVIGISFEYRANREKARGAPIELVFPKEGLGWDLEAIAIAKGTKNMDAAKKLIDWAVTDEAMGLYAANFAIVAVPSLSKPLPNVPADYASRLVKNDFAWAAANRDKILAEWSKRYESKAAPK